jgi:hypothetical protein
MWGWDGVLRGWLDNYGPSVWMSCRASTRTLLATKNLGGPGDGLRSERGFTPIVRSAVLTGVGNGKRMSYSVQGLVASPCPALTKNSVGARDVRRIFGPVR